VLPLSLLPRDATSPFTSRRLEGLAFPIPTSPVELQTPEPGSVVEPVRVAPLIAGVVFITKTVPVPVCEAIAVAFPTDVIGPVMFALVATVEAVPVRGPENAVAVIVPAEKLPLASLFTSVNPNDDGVAPFAKLAPIATSAAVTPPT
jgi:hypothetical protein